MPFVLQYSIDGPLLMAMTDEQMRKGLNILPLGHRETIKKKIQVGCFASLKTFAHAYTWAHHPQDTG